MLTEYVTHKDDFLEISQGRIRFVIQQEPIRFSNMGGTGIMTGPEVTVYVKYTAISAEHIMPQRIIAMKVRIGVLNRYEETFNDKLTEIRETAPKEFDLANDEYHGHREVKEGVFE